MESANRLTKKGQLSIVNSDTSTDLSVPDPLRRIRIERPLLTGQRVIDGFLSLGLGTTSWFVFRQRRWQEYVAR